MLGDANFPARPSLAPERLLHRGAKFDFVQGHLPGPGGTTIPREFIRHPGAVIILPILDQPTASNPRLVLIRNWRLSLARDLLELPAGTLTPGEDPALAAIRELEEETGYHAATLVPLARFHTSPGLSDELMHAFIARGLTPGPPRLEPDERIVVVPTPLDDALALIQSGTLTDAKSILTILLALRGGHLPSR